MYTKGHGEDKVQLPSFAALLSDTIITTTQRNLLVFFLPSRSHSCESLRTSDPPVRKTVITSHQNRSDVECECLRVWLGRTHLLTVNHVRRAQEVTSKRTRQRRWESGLNRLLKCQHEQRRIAGRGASIKRHKQTRVQPYSEDAPSCPVEGNAVHRRQVSQDPLVHLHVLVHGGRHQLPQAVGAVQPAAEAGLHWMQSKQTRQWGRTLSLSMYRKLLWIAGSSKTFIFTDIRRAPVNNRRLWWSSAM